MCLNAQYSFRKAALGTYQPSELHYPNRNGYKGKYVTPPFTSIGLSLSGTDVHLLTHRHVVSDSGMAELYLHSTIRLNGHAVSKLGTWATYNVKNTILWVVAHGSLDVSEYRISTITWERRICQGRNQALSRVL